jgi:hypothetical protein
MSPTAMFLSWCMVLVVWTRGSLELIGLLPPFRPRARAAASPALVRSWISRLSN